MYTKRYIKSQYENHKKNIVKMINKLFVRIKIFVYNTVLWNI